MQRLDRARIKFCQTTACEVITDLVFHRIEGGGGSGSGIPKGKNGVPVTLRFCPPTGIGLCFGEEVVYLVLRNPWLPTAVLFCSQTFADIFDEISRCLIIGRRYRDNAIAIKFGLSKDLLGICRILKRNRCRLGFAQVGKNLLCRSQELNSVRRSLVNCRQGKSTGALGQVVGVFQHRTSPLYGGKEFRDTNAPVPVSVNQLQRPAITLQAMSWTTQRGPEFLVQLIQGQQVGSGLKLNLVKPTGTKETPLVESIWHNASVARLRKEETYQRQNFLSSVLHLLSHQHLLPVVSRSQLT